MVAVAFIRQWIRLFAITGAVVTVTVVNGAALARETNQDSASYYSWPRWLKEFSQRTVISSKTIEEDDVRYIVACCRDDAKNQEMLFLQAKCMAAMLQRVPFNDGVPELLATALAESQYKFPVDTERIKSVFRKDKPSVEALNKKCANIIAQKGSVKLESSTPAIFVALLKYKGITPEIYKRLVIENPDSGKDAIDALVLSDDEDEYVLLLSEIYLVDGGIKQESRLLLGISPYMHFDNANKLLEQVPVQKPVRYHLGQPVYESSSNDIHEMLRAEAEKWKGLLPFYKQYRAAESDEDIAKLVAELPDGSQFTGNVGWSVYRYFPEASSILWAKYKSLDLPAVYGEKYKSVLSSFLAHCRVCPELNNTCNELCKAIRGQVAEGGNAISKVNGLFLMEVIANDDDLDQLRKCVHDESILSWKQGKRTMQGPLVALRAVMCIAAIHSDRSHSVLKTISEDKGINDQARRLAQDMYKRAQHEH